MSADPNQYVALASLQNELGRFVMEEHAIQGETMRQLWAQQIEERVEEGRCIADLRVTSQTASGGWMLECPGNDSRFREGDFVRLSRGDPQVPFMDAIVQSISRETSNNGAHAGSFLLAAPIQVVDTSPARRPLRCVPPG